MREKRTGFGLGSEPVNLAASRQAAALNSSPTLFCMPLRTYLLNRLNTRPRSPYRLPIASYTSPVCDLSRMVAVASVASLFGLPRTSHTASVTRGVLRIRLTFHEPSSVMTSSRSPSGAAQIGVGLGRPSLVNVVNRRYFALETSSKVGATGSI